MTKDTKPKRPFAKFFRFGLRFFLFAILVFAVWIAWHVQQTENQRNAIKQIREFGGTVHYDFEYQDGKPDNNKPNGGFLPSGQSKIPEWLIRKLGIDFFHPIVELNLIADTRNKKPTQPTTAVEYYDTEWASLLGSFPRLRNLMIKGQQVNNDVLAAIGKLDSIEELHILGSDSVAWMGRGQIPTDADISNDGIKFLSNAVTLKSVSISFCQLDDATLSHLSKLRNLESLTLQGCRFTDAGVAKLKHNQRLISLWLDESQGVTDESINLLASLPNLRTLTIQNSMITKDGERKFSTMNPNCRFRNYPITENAR